MQKRKGRGLQQEKQVLTGTVKRHFFFFFSQRLERNAEIFWQEEKKIWKICLEAAGVAGR